jgi:RNA polymerase sigma factor (sigma-70 family)
MNSVNFTSGNNLTDRLLIDAILRGDTQAFNLIIKNTEGLVVQVVVKMVSNPEDRKDLVQDIYLKTFHNLAGFRFQSKLLTWIGNIAYNTCVNYLEKKKLVLTGVDEENEYDSGMEIESIISRKELSSILAAGIEKLPPLYKTLISLYHQEECSYADMAQITGLPEGTVKNYLFRARKTLKENILNLYKKEEL